MIGCEKSINITQPTIIVKNDSPHIYDSISINVIENADIDGSRVSPDYFSWSILNINNEVIYSDFLNSSSIYWIPDSIGHYIISVKIGYDNNKSMTALKEIIIQENSFSFQKKLIGSWTGKAVAMFGITWDVNLKFDSIGHYSGSAYNIPNSSYRNIGPFYFGMYEVDNPNGGQMGIKPSEDVPCTRFTLDKITDNMGYGVLSISYESEAFGTPYHYNCTDNFKIKDFVYLNNDSISFSLLEFGAVNYDWYLKYNLHRVE